MQKPLISIVIPTFNRADLITRSINSVLSQRRIDNIEVIIVDDYSKDNTSDVISKIKDARVRYVQLDQNKGGAAARNVGIENSKGEYIAFLDSDDTWSQNKLTKQFEYFNSINNNHCLVLHTKIRVNRNNFIEVKPEREKKQNESIAEYLFMNGGHMQTSSLFMKTAFAKKTMFDPTLRKHQDYDFCLRLENNGAEFKLLNEVLVTWNHDDRKDRITNSYGLAASEHFYSTRKQAMGNASSSAFWINTILLPKFKTTPFVGTIELIKCVIKSDLTVCWYLNWFKKSLKNYFKKRIHFFSPQNQQIH